MTTPERIYDDDGAGASLEAKKFRQTVGSLGKARKPAPKAPPVPVKPKPKNASQRRVEQLRPLTIEEIGQLPDLTWLIDGYLPEGGLTRIYGPPDVGKSFIALDWALSVASGAPWLGHRTGAPREVVYIYAEGQYGLKYRIDAWREAHGRALDLSRFRAVLCPVNMLDGPDRAFLVTAIKEVGSQPALIVIDTKARCFGDGDENQTRDMNRFVTGCDEFRLEHFSGTPVTVLVVDHTGKDVTKGGRGSNALEGAGDTEFYTAPVKGDPDACVLKNTKQKHRAKLQPLGLRRVDIGPSCALARDEGAEEAEEQKGRKVASIDIVYNALTQFGAAGTTFQRWFAECGGMSESSFKRHRKELIKNGWVCQQGPDGGHTYACSPGGTVGDLGCDRTKPRAGTAGTVH